MTTLRCAEKFDQSHLSSPEVAPLIAGAKAYYVEGYFLTHGVSCILELGSKAAIAGKVWTELIYQSFILNPFSQTVILNLSAPFIPQYFGAQLQQVIPYCDIIICNEAEAESWASANGVPNPKDLPAVAKAIAILPKSNASKPRIVVFTQGADSTILVSSADPDSPKVFGVKALTDSQIVDTNGAGDAFAGGFIGAYVAEKSLDECVLAGHAMGAMCVQQVCSINCER